MPCESRISAKVKLEMSLDKMQKALEEMGHSIYRSVSGQRSGLTFSAGLEYGSGSYDERTGTLTYNGDEYEAEEFKKKIIQTKAKQIVVGASAYGWRVTKVANNKYQLKR